MAITLPTAGQTPWDVTLNTALTSLDTTNTSQAASITTLNSQAALLLTPTIRTATGTTDTLVIGDAYQVVHRSNAASNTATIPPNSSVAFAIGTYVRIRQWSTGVTTIAAGAGVTIRSRGGALVLGGQYGTAYAEKVGTDEWVLEGDIT